MRLHIPALLCLKKFVKPSMRKVGMATSSNSLALIGIYWFECPPRKIELSEKTHVWAMHFSLIYQRLLELSWTCVGQNL